MDEIEWGTRVAMGLGTHMKPGAVGVGPEVLNEKLRPNLAAVLRSGSSR